MVHRVGEEWGTLREVEWACLRGRAELQLYQAASPLGESAQPLRHLLTVTRGAMLAPCSARIKAPAASRARRPSPGPLPSWPRPGAPPCRCQGWGWGAPPPACGRTTPVHQTQGEEEEMQLFRLH